MRRLWNKLIGKRQRNNARRSPKQGVQGTKPKRADTPVLNRNRKTGQLLLFSASQQQNNAGQPTRQLPQSVITVPTGHASTRALQQQKYDALVVEMKARYALRIRKWRSNTTGCAWAVTYTDGSVSRLIEAPYPKGPVSAAVFLHEVGHHAIGLATVRPRCLEEYCAWQWSLVQMEAHGLELTARVKQRVVEALHYAVCKADRRGLKRLPAELVGYVDRRCTVSEARIEALIELMMADAGAMESRVG